MQTSLLIGAYYWPNQILMHTNPNEVPNQGKNAMGYYHPLLVRLP